MNVALILIIIHWILFHYTFEFQRITLALARLQNDKDTKDYQILLSPNWIGLLGWTLNIVHIVAVILVFLYYGWIFAIIYLALTFLGIYSIIGYYIPFPPKKHFFKIIKNNLLNKIKRGDIENTLIYRKIIEAEKNLKLQNNL